MDSSDSDDDLLPSFEKFNAVFNQVHAQVRKAPLPKPSGSKSMLTKKSSQGKEKHDSFKKNSSVLNTPVEKSKKVKKSCGVEFSDDTKELLEEMDRIRNDDFTNGVVNTSSTTATTSIVKSERETSSLRSGKAKAEPSGVKTRSRKAKQGKKKVVEDIVLISDNDDEDHLEVLNSSTFNNSSNIEMMVEPVHETCSIRVRWMDEILLFKVSEETKLSEIRMQIAEKILKRADNLIILDETSSDEVSDNTTVGSIPFGRTLEVFVRESSANNNVNLKSLDPNYVLIKLQGSGGYRERYTVAIKRTTGVKQLIEDFVDKFKCHGKKFKLVFDGEELDLSETPESLDMENNDMIDVVEI